VFDRFYKADPGRSRRGSGLGLAIARQHAQAQGGTLTAANDPDGGACFTFTLPAAPDDRDPQSAAAAAPLVGADAPR
jgi:signal transduction histidine kinase